MHVTLRMKRSTAALLSSLYNAISLHYDYFWYLSETSAYQHVSAPSGSVVHVVHIHSQEKRCDCAPRIKDHVDRCRMPWFLTGKMRQP
ncbi:hypothetical protein BU24DRAFT_124140 [Aaosphaeria arxii CBS 175.79]|uniref:Uncharacterized protein n=1 Tax=Aaosphaeria arxii CBS 175.79 TaxID=1450172 RepID=A0A6A5Y2G4_9PLEO|nr:uncharacterized protein BU24DRAFT_124140 [Aaosphaeria arxii CBS 175.79]KAF2019638.1 hypothetical protein BU24DRAFT_124140 [Aaosphaeria arxii CBS 175.79]